MLTCKAFGWRDLHHRAVCLPAPERPGRAQEKPMKFVHVLFASSAVLALAACQGFPERAPAGSLLTGALAGAAPGSVAARAMDDSDRRRAAIALDTASDGKPSAWRNHETGNSFVFTPTHSFARAGSQCRDFKLEVVAGARPDSIGASACRQADGSWRVPG
ncbi:surface antigen [Variovorax boronicumulans]|uniref:RT0821/Lpp0805 family surface protein n=1 Tax=Variovorax boronicumulans TaxID=436515 RepID=UPI0033992BA6